MALNQAFAPAIDSDDKLQTELECDEIEESANLLEPLPAAIHTDNTTNQDGQQNIDQAQETRYQNRILESSQVSRESRLSMIFDRPAMTNMFHHGLNRDHQEERISASADIPEEEEEQNPLEMAPRRRNRVAMQPSYDPNVNYSEIMRRDFPTFNRTSYRSQIREVEMLSQNTENKPAFKEFLSEEEYHLSHPSWLEEVEESMTLDIFQKMQGALSQDLGVLGVLIFIRLQNYLQVSMASSDQLNTQGFLV